MITADSQPLWPGELTAWGTLAVAAVAVAVALFAEWRASKRVVSERDYAATVLAAERKAAEDRLTRQLEHSDQQLADERKVAGERLQAQMAHSDQQLREERQQAQDALQLSEAYAIRVFVGLQDGRITDPHISAEPGDVLRSLVAVVVNEGRFTVTDVAVGLYSSSGAMTNPARVDRIADDSLLRMEIEGMTRDMGDRMLAPGASGLRFAGNAQLERYLIGAYPVVRWTDHWGQMWESSKGRVRKTNSGTTMTAWP